MGERLPLGGGGRRTYEVCKMTYLFWVIVCFCALLIGAGFSAVVHFGLLLKFIGVAALAGVILLFLRK